MDELQIPLTKDKKIHKIKNQIELDINQIIEENIFNAKLQTIALSSVEGGKKIRPIIAYSIIKKMNPNISDARLKTVNSIEILHSASLMIDDMMDNDDMRRGKISPHILYGNDVTLLTASQMIIISFKLISEIDMNYITNIYLDKTTTVEERQEKLKSYKLILNSILDKTTNLIDGQTLDLDNNNYSDKKMVLNVLSKKTASIFEMIFILSWVLGEGDPRKICIIEVIAQNFGIMFQICDDFTDIIKDSSKNFNLNYVLHFGVDEARNEFYKRKNKFLEKIIELDIMTYEIDVFAEYLSNIVDTISKNYPYLMTQ
jgi:geranylgeranyl pyrophosphate synthase